MYFFALSGNLEDLWLNNQCNVKYLHKATQKWQLTTVELEQTLMGKSKGRKGFSKTATIEEANDVAPDMLHEVGVYNYPEAMQELHKHQGKELMEDVNWFEANPDVQADVLTIPLPDTILKPPTKKVKRDKENAEILEAIRELSGKHDEIFQKISAIERTTESTSRQMEKLTTTEAHIRC